MLFKKPFSGLFAATVIIQHNSLTKKAELTETVKWLPGAGEGGK